jgi:undecaprenyl diphosphate synthase
MHIAIIMDGNGRWAARRHLPRAAGHRAGVQAVDRIVQEAARAGVEMLTLYALSSDNWQRPPTEVSTLLGLLHGHLAVQTRRCLERSIRLHVIGQRDRLPQGLSHAIQESQRATAHCSRMHLRLAVDYSARRSLAAAGRRLASEPASSDGRLLELLSEVDHCEEPARAVDLLIRTGGERRLSDFLLYECAYAELHFVDCLWPDFDEQALRDALGEYGRRDRRFGRIAASPEAAHHG